MTRPARRRRRHTGSIRSFFLAGRGSYTEGNRAPLPSNRHIRTSRARKPAARRFLRQHNGWSLPQTLLSAFQILLPCVQIGLLLSAICYCDSITRSCCSCQFQKRKTRLELSKLFVKQFLRDAFRLKELLVLLCKHIVIFLVCKNSTTKVQIIYNLTIFNLLFFSFFCFFSFFHSSIFHFFLTLNS